MENSTIQAESPEIQPEKKKKKRIWLWVLLLFILIVIYTQIGVYTIQPIGALPEGVTAIVWRNSGEPFYNSPDAVCLEIQGGVSLFCRMLAMGNAPTDRIIMRLPYSHWAYLRSTGGLEFDQ